MNQTIVAEAGTSHVHSIVIVGDLEDNADRLDEVYEQAVARGPHELIDRLKERMAERDERILLRAAEAIECNTELLGAFVQLSVNHGTLACQAFVGEQYEDELIRSLRSIDGVRRIQIRVIQ